MLLPSLSCSMYAIAMMNTDSHCTKNVADYFSFQPRFGNIGLNGSKTRSLYVLYYIICDSYRRFFYR